MKFFGSVTVAATLFAALASAYNGFAGPAEGEVIPAGKPYIIKWTADTPGPVYINLRKGARKNLDTLYQIVMLETNWGNYTWNVPADTPAGKDYAFELKWGKSPRPEDVNYTGLFEISSDGKGGEVKSKTESPYPSGTATATGTAHGSSTTTVTTPTTITNSTSNTTVTSIGYDHSATETPTSTMVKNNTKSSSTPTNTPPPKETNSAGILGASMGMAVAVAVAAAALL